MHPSTLTESLWTATGGDPAQLDWLRFTQTETQLPSTFAVGALASATIAVQALAAASLWHLRGGTPQSIEVDQRRAMAMFRSERYVQVDGAALPDPWSPIAGHYQAGDGRWIQLHTNFPHHRDGVLRVLQCADDRSAVATAIGQWNAAELDARLAQDGMCAALVRSPGEWAATEQAKAVATLPLFDIERIADAPPEAPGAASGVPPRPLSGVRVLDLSRVIAAPVAARTLAQHGADVLAVSAAHLPNLPAVVVDTGRGKRATQLDLRNLAQRAQLRELIRGADIFLHAYRPGALAALGFSSEELQALRPGLIEVCLSAYSHTGPWAQRRGFDSLVQSASGIAWESGLAAGVAQPGQPGKLPCQALDHATGYLAAYVAMAALRRRAQEGGGWRARVSLAQTGRWLQSLPRVADGLQHPDLSREELAQALESTPSAYGMVRAVAPVETMSATPPRFDLPPAPLDAHRPEWA
jgi:crotonobetainyl-CoA:carnitine CoA-transferase CaiB-like acyl-CoA transferase